MPSNINASKIFVYCYDVDGEETLFEKNEISTLDSDVFNPHYRMVFRISSAKMKEYMNLHFYILFTTIEEVAGMTSREKKVVSTIMGVSYFPFFIKGTGHEPAPPEQEVRAGDQDYILNSGNYSLPIYFPQYTEMPPQALRGLLLK